METLKVIIAVIVLFIGLPLLIVWLNDKIFHRPLSKTKMQEYSRHFQERLLNPDFAAVEAHLGCALPEELKKLYANKAEVLRGDFEVLGKTSDEAKDAWYVGFYMPADGEAVRDAWPDCKAFFAFADDGCGNCYLVDPRLPNLEVFFYDHEGGEFNKLGLNLTEFVSAPRRTPID